ncbi:MAG: CXXX repeat peptide modification system protein [Tannerellaceae bacterium]|jgi:CXXX repeat modification system protein|nr:CXXX repeat peptide modification system protein [Tannerellaceae bacterium]
MKKRIGRVSEKEKKEIQVLSNRKNGLNELLRIISTGDDNKLHYEKLMIDLIEANISFNQWWDKMSERYQWEKHPNANWEIDFLTNEVYLVGDSL